MAQKTLRNSSDRILSISAIIIAVVSILVSVWEGTETRKHNRLSVQSKLEISFKANVNNFGYSLVNSGLGPAIIYDKKTFVDGKEIDYSGFSGFEDFLEKLGLEDRYMGQGAINPGNSIKAGRTENIILFKLNEEDDREKVLPEIYSRVSFEIE